MLKKLKDYGFSLEQAKNLIKGNVLKTGHGNYKLNKQTLTLKAIYNNSIKTIEL